MSQWLNERRSGVLMHISSLPGNRSMGELGPNAYRFVDYLASAGFSVWQVLPLGPTLANGSPYQSPSANAGNPQFISLEMLRDWGWLPADSDLVNGSRAALLALAFDWFQRNEQNNPDFQEFWDAEDWWLADFALFQALKEEYDGIPWWDWPIEIRDRDPQAIAAVAERLSDRVDFYCFEQLVFDKQWHQLRAYANERGVQLYGDLPIFVAEDAVDVWVSRELFDLNDNGRPHMVAGVPPDYFSKTGQRWGNPLYRWECHAADDYAWWTRRMCRQLELYDLLRIDHFRGFESYWAIPAENDTAIEGEWLPGPGQALFAAMEKTLGTVPVVAEDLGIITREVEELRDALGFPGMKILHFAFDGRADNPYLPQNGTPLSVIYTGTHDNDTTMGWFDSLDSGSRERVQEYLGHSRLPFHEVLIRTALSSVCGLAVVPVQDLLGLGAESRMNVPGQVDGNWGWRLGGFEALENGAANWRKLNTLFGRGTTKAD